MKKNAIYYLSCENSKRKTAKKKLEAHNSIKLWNFDDSIILQYLEIKFQ